MAIVKWWQETNWYYASIQLLLLVVFVTCANISMNINSHQAIIDDIQNDNYYTSKDNYYHFTQLPLGTSIAEDGIVHRSHYLGYVHNVIIDGAVVGIDERIDEPHIETLQDTRFITYFHMLLAQSHLWLLVSVWLFFNVFIKLMIRIASELYLNINTASYNDEVVKELKDTHTHMMKINQHSSFYIIDGFFIATLMYMLMINNFIPLGFIFFIYIIYYIFITWQNSQWLNLRIFDGGEPFGN